MSRSLGFALIGDSGYGDCMTLEAIKEAFVQLSKGEQEQFADWCEEREQEAWDEEMERDFSPGGRGDHLVERIDREIEHIKATGGVTSLEEGLRIRREQRATK